MGDLISRQAAIEIIQSMYSGMPRVPWMRKDWQKRYEPYMRTENAIRKLPSAQPEIIRCGQCKYAEAADPEDSQDGYTCQFHRGSIWFSGSYCSWAERRQDE